MPFVLNERREPRLLLVSLSDGIGGMRRGAERLQLPVPIYIAAEPEAAARRSVRAAWPG